MSGKQVPAITQGCSIELISSILEGYATRGIFAGYRQVSRQSRKADFMVQWHFHRILVIRLDMTKSCLRIPDFLPNVSTVPDLHRELSAYLHHWVSPDRLPHRRIDPGKTNVSCYVRNGSLSLRFTVEDGDFEYATRKLVHLVNEIFLDFLREAQYVEYMVAHMDMNPETGHPL